MHHNKKNGHLGISNDIIRVDTKPIANRNMNICSRLE